MNRRRFLQAAAVTTALEPFALAAAADNRARSRCRSFVRSLPAPETVTDASGYAFSFTNAGREVDDRLPDADAYGRIVLPRAVVTAAFGTDDVERDPGVSSGGGTGPAEWWDDRPLFLDRGRTRYRAVVPGSETAIYGSGPAREPLVGAMRAFVRARSGEDDRYYDRSPHLPALLDRLGTGAHLSATVRPDGLAPAVVAAGDRIGLRDGDAHARGATVFDSEASAAASDAVATAGKTAPLPGSSRQGTVVRHDGRTIVRETTVDRAVLAPEADHD